MRYIYTLIITLFSLVVCAQAQVTIYHENFSSPVTGFTSAPASEWVISNLTPSDLLQASGGNNVRTSISTANGARERSLTLNNRISTIGYKNLKLSWRAFRTQNWRQGNTVFTSRPSTGNPSKIDNNKPVVLEYSTNGRDFTVVNFTQNTTTFAAWYNANGGADIALPTILENQANVILRWKIVVDNTNEDYFAIDDVVLSGTPEEGIATLDWNTYPQNENPFAAGKIYNIDGKQISFSRSSSAGVELPVAKVTDSLFQTGSKSLTLVQRKATANTGSTITVRFSEPVYDLTFNLLDVDQSQNQFQDRLFITAKNPMNATVSAQKSQVITTSKNQFSATSNEFRGISGTDVPASSTDGNIKISFGVAVVEVTIVYNNTEAVRNFDGQQGISIHNLMWRKEAQITPLPVTLVSFKGSMQSGAARLNWSTASEINNEKFIVERSQDGKVFKAVGEVVGRGNSNIMQNYTFSDKAPAFGTNYYRLKQIDFDGTFEYSKTIALHFAVAGHSSVYPTLATQEITIKLATAVGQANVFISDISGRQLAAVQNTTDRQLVLPVQHLQSGIYFVTVVSDEQKETIRFVKK